jgi:hypothetical protein
VDGLDEFQGFEFVFTVFELETDRVVIEKGIGVAGTGGRYVLCTTELVGGDDG